jgi:hypothetical protein
MKVVFKRIAEDTLREIVEFVDDINVSGAGERWAEKLMAFLQRFAHIESIKTYPLCHNESLALAGMSCIIYKGWVIVYKKERGSLVVHQIIKGSLLY